MTTHSLWQSVQASGERGKGKRAVFLLLPPRELGTVWPRAPSHKSRLWLGPAVLDLMAPGITRHLPLFGLSRFLKVKINPSYFLGEGENILSVLREKSGPSYN